MYIPRVPSAALDIEDTRALTAYLRALGRVGPEETPAVEVLGGGVSGRVVRVRADGGPEVVLKQALARLRVPGEWSSDPRRIHCEAAGLRVLHELGLRVPRLVFEDHEHHVIGMEAVSRPHTSWKSMLLAGDARREHYLGFAALLAAIHRESGRRLDHAAAALGSCDHFESLRLDPYYRASARAVPSAGPFLDRLIRDTTATRATLVHGDYSPKNVLVCPDGLVLVDHEVAHIGDPAFDVGFALTHLLSKAHHLEAHRAALGSHARAWWEAYSDGVATETWAHRFEERCARHAVGCLLARVAGRSTLEYLTAAERARQLAVATALAIDPPHDTRGLIDTFLEALG